MGEVLVLKGLVCGLFCVGLVAPSATLGSSDDSPVTRCARFVVRIGYRHRVVIGTSR